MVPTTTLASVFAGVFTIFAEQWFTANFAGDSWLDRRIPSDCVCPICPEPQDPELCTFGEPPWELLFAVCNRTAEFERVASGDSQQVGVVAFASGVIGYLVTALADRCLRPAPVRDQDGARGAPRTAPPRRGGGLVQ